MERALVAPMSQMMENKSTCSTPSEPPSYYTLFSKQFLQRHGRDLFSCAASWFLVDMVFYSNTLFQSQIYEFFLPNRENENAFQEAYSVAKLQAIIAICSTIPGYWATVCLIDRIGRRKIQMLGFIVMAFCLFAIGGAYDCYWDRKSTGAKIGFMILYGLMFFFSNLGPNTTTFIVPAELFPARFRTTCHGISGAAGKVGAIIGSIGFLWASHNKKEKGYPKAIGMTGALNTLAVICVLGALVTYFFTPETNDRSLEENEKENGSKRKGNGSITLP